MQIEPAYEGEEALPEDATTMLKTFGPMFSLSLPLAAGGYFIGGEVAASIMGILGLIIGQQASQLDAMKAEISALQSRIYEVETGKVSGAWAIQLEQRLDDEVRILNNEIERTQHIAAA